MRRTGQAAKQNETEQEPQEKKVHEFKRAVVTGPDHFEWSLVTGIIVNTDFLKEMRAEITENLRYIKSVGAQRVLKWCYEYFDEYDKAPGLYIRDIFEKEKDGLPPGEEDLISGLLSKLSDKHEQHQKDGKDFDAVYEIAQVRRELERAKLHENASEQLRLLNNNDLEGARDLARSYKPYETSQSILETILQCEISASDLCKEEIPAPRRMLEPWLTSESLSMIYGPSGIGKTWLGLLIAFGLTRLTRKNRDAVEIGSWQVRRPMGTVYLDGEMPQYWLKDRLNRLELTMGEEDPDFPLTILSKPRIGKQSFQRCNLTDPKWRDAVYQRMAMNKRQRLLILDNIASLFPGLDENSKEAWDPYNQWLLELRNLGVSVILVHHAGKGKDGKQRGTSGREDNLDNIIKLSEPPGYKKSDGAWFKVSFDKARNVGSKKGDDITPFTLRVQSDGAHGVIWTAGKAEGQTSDKQNTIMALLIDGNMRGTEIAEKMGCSPTYVTQTKTAMKERGLLTKGGEPSREGHQWRNGVELDGLFSEAGGAG